MFPGILQRRLFHTSPIAKMTVQRLVRFVSKDDGATYYGAANESLQKAKALNPGNPFSPHTQVDNHEHEIEKLLCPVDIDHARSVVCIGLNYTDHAEEAKMPIPKVPVVLYVFIFDL